MSKQKLNAAAPAAALCAAMALATLPAAAAGQSGMIVVRDPQTGEYRAPTPAELQALHTQGAAKMAPSAAAAPAVVPRGDGKLELRMGDRGRVYSVVKRDADGKMVKQCVQGEQAARDALRADAPVVQPGQEHKHD